MEIFQWEVFLKQESNRIIDVYSRKDDFKKTSAWGYVWKYNEIPPDAIKLRWLGNIGASEKEIQFSEKRLGIKFPPSYRNFLRVTNGWEGWNLSEIGGLYSSKEVVRFSEFHQDFIDSMMRDEEKYPYIVELDDRKYFSYGPDQYAYRARHLQQCLLINDYDKGDSAHILLNPNVIHNEEWEAWAIFEGGVKRWISFELMFKEMGIAGEWIEELSEELRS